jgi:RNA polymerase sigma-70 factor, ECF subfamily
MVRLAHGDRDAFGLVFDGLWPHVHGFVMRAMPGHPDAEDLAQQTLLKIFARISNFDTGRDGVAWAFGIASYEIKTLRRQLQRRREVPDDEGMDRPAREHTPEEAAIDRNLRAALIAVLGEMTPADRAALLTEGPDGSFSISPTAWRKRRQRALERLRALWRKRHA